MARKCCEPDGAATWFFPVTGSWGATETAPAVTSAHYPHPDARCIGVPLPGAEVKLVPAEEGAY